ncbi:MAG: ferrous iron transport protein A [Peptococcaceae bacterium]|nr:ferrous iron transport protein A [Peptococcaceae bacterium]
MNLNDSYIDKTYRVVQVTGLELPVERRLEALGLTEGTRITVLNKKNKGAVIVKVRGSRFAVGNNIAAGIRIEEVAIR